MSAEPETHPAHLGDRPLIALGAAGLVAGMDAPATTGAHPWQTARDDALVGQRLDAITADLEEISAQLDALGV